MAGRTYAERLHALNLDSLKDRRIHTDLINAYKLLFGQYDVDVCQLFERHNYAATRSHGYKLKIPFARSDVRQNSYAVRVSKWWNKLPPNIVDFASVRKFANSLYKVDFSNYC
jgi:hypothetical protein